MSATTWQHPSPFSNDGDRDALPFLREIRKGSIKQIATFERMADECSARVGGGADAARYTKFADAERVCLADIDARIAARKAKR